MSASTFQVTIKLSSPTLSALAASGDSLVAYAAVQSSDQAAQPLVWMTTQEYMEFTVVEYRARFEAYTVPADATAPVLPGFSAGITTDQTLTVQSAQGTGAVTEGGTGDAITIENATTTPLGCGISQPVGGAMAPVCLLPLHGGSGQIIKPVPSLLLLFSTTSGPAGTVADTAGGPGVLLDLETAGACSVAFDIDQGWDWGGATWGQEVPFGTPLGPLLTASSESLAVWAFTR